MRLHPCYPIGKESTDIKLNHTLGKAKPSCWQIE